MKNRTGKKKGSWEQWFIILCYLLIGAVCGFMMVKFIDMTSTPDSTLGQELFSLGLLFLGMYVLLYLHIIFHEAGHLVFGLLTGYGFSSFRIGSLMWVKEQGRLRFRRLSIAGTSGQCLMTPPDQTGDALPVVLYNLGGSLMNIAVALLSLVIFFLVKTSLFSALLLMSVLIGMVYALINGLPLHLGLVDNDGCNALALHKDAVARRAFWIQMKINEQIASGVRLREMPEEWFVMPTDEQMNNSMNASIGVFACNRLMDAHRFEEANGLMTHLLEMDTAMIGVYRNLMVCDLLFLELIGECRADHIESLLTVEQKKFMKTMKTFPTVLRTEYAMALLGQGDCVQVEKIRQQFETCARTYPYPNEVKGERELIALADEKYSEKSQLTN